MKHKYMSLRYTHRFTTDCDMGCVKIFNDTMSVFYQNGVGDVPTTVTVDARLKAGPPWPKGEFLSHFTVKTEAHLAAYDCGDRPVYAFKPGRYFVYRVEDAHIHIQLVDTDIHA